MANRSDIKELAKRLHEKGYTVENLKSLGRRFGEGGETYSGGEIKDSSVSVTLSRGEWDKLYKEGKVKLVDIPRKYQSWIEGNNSQLKHNVTKAIDDFGGKYVIPAVTGLAFGPAGAIGALANTVSDMAIQGATRGEKQTFGDLFFDPQEHPYLNLAANLVNPVNFIALDSSAPTLINRMPKNNAEALYQTLARVRPKGLSRFYKWVPEKGKFTLHRYRLSDQAETATDFIVGSVDIPKNISKKTAGVFARRLTSATNTPPSWLDSWSAAKQLSDIQYNLKTAEKTGVLTDFIRKTESMKDGIPRYINYGSDKQLYKLIGGKYNTVSFIKHGNNLSVFEFGIRDGKLASRYKVGTFSIPKNLKPEYYSTMLQGLREELLSQWNKKYALDDWVAGLKQLDKEGTLNMFFDPQYEHVANHRGLTANLPQSIRMRGFKSGLDEAQLRRQVLDFSRGVQNKDIQLVKSIFGDSYLGKILQESPQYTDRAIELRNIGMDEEQIVKQLLDDRFTFARGVNMRNFKTSEMASEPAALALTHVPEIAIGGRADIEVFGKLADNEDALYTSNSLATALGYSYPESKTPGFVGVLKRRPETFDFSGSPLDWWHHNQLPDNVKIAPSTGKHLLYDNVDYLSKMYKSKFGENIQVPYILEGLLQDGKISSYNRPNTFNHFLMRGNRGEQPLDYMYLYKQIPASGLSLEDIQKEMGVPVGEGRVTRWHYGDITPGFSQGNALGGKIERRFDEGGQTPPDSMTEEAQTLVNDWQNQHAGTTQSTRDLFLKNVGNAYADVLYPTDYDGFIFEGATPPEEDKHYYDRIKLRRDMLNLKNAHAKSIGERYLPDSGGLKIRNPFFMADPTIEGLANGALDYYNAGIPVVVNTYRQSDRPDASGFFNQDTPNAINRSDDPMYDSSYHEYSHLMDNALGNYIYGHNGDLDGAAGILLGRSTPPARGSFGSTSQYLTRPTEVTARLHAFRQKNAIGVNRRDFTADELMYGELRYDKDLQELANAYGYDYDALAKALNETYEEGGPLDKEPVQKPQIDTVRLRQLVDRINRTSNADFVKRLLDKNRKVLNNGEGSVSTHELSYTTDDKGNAVVFPEVQSDDSGFLNRYPWPLSYDRAVQRGDTLMMSVPDAELFTDNNYKMMYPHGNGFATGGDLLSEQDEPLVLPEVVVTPNGNYVNYTGSESSRPTLQEFLEARSEGARVRAVNNMLNTEHPVVPAVPSKLARYAIRLGAPESSAIKLFGYANSPHTCIATTTSQFDDPEAYVPGNITFDTNRTGFIQVGDYDYLPGDLINLYENGTPYHSTMVTGIEGSPNEPYALSPVLTYSNGGIDRDGNLSMRYNKNNLYDDGDETTPDFGVEQDNQGKNTYKVFRYVGSPSVLANWMDEYRRLYSPTGTVRNPDSRQSVKGYKFETMPDGKLRVVRGK